MAEADYAVNKLLAGVFCNCRFKL